MIPFCSAILITDENFGLLFLGRYLFSPESKSVPESLTVSEYLYIF